MKKIFYIVFSMFFMSSCIVVLPNKSLRTSIKVDKKLTSKRNTCNLTPYPKNKKFTKYKLWRRMYR